MNWSSNRGRIGLVIAAAAIGYLATDHGGTEVTVQSAALASEYRAAPPTAEPSPAAGFNPASMTSTVAATSNAVAAGSNSAPAAQVVEEHARGVFFDWRPVHAEAARRAQASKPSADRLQMVQIVDPNGFGQPIVAMTMDIPQGWRHEGGVSWDRSVECSWNGPRMSFDASSPDGLHGIALFPTMGWQVASMPLDRFDPCPAAPMATPRQYLEFIASNARPNARVLAYRDRPDLSRDGRFPVAGGELLIAYTLSGHEMREVLVTALTYTSMAPGGKLVNSDLTLAVRAPDGLLDFTFSERVRSSLQWQSDWRSRYMQWAMAKIEQAGQRAAATIAEWHNRRMNEINLAGMTARHNIRMGTIAEIGRINTQIFNDRMASGERIQAATIDAIQEVQPWRDPGTGRQVDLSMHYNHAWQLDDGRQFLTNDPSFEPYRDLGLGGRRLEPVR